jgi:hypothetical protein
MSELDQFIVPLVKCPQGAGLHDTRSITCPYCELTKLRVALDESIKVIEFYSNPESWVRGKNDGNMAINATDREHLNPCNYGGRRAREFLSKHSELIKGEEV